MRATLSCQGCSSKVCQTSFGNVSTRGLAKTFELACTGHPKWFFIVLLPSLQNCAYFRLYPP
jgi:hypothetical protein